MYSISDYLSKSQNIFAYKNLLVLRYARTRPLGGKNIITRILRIFYPKLTLKTKIFKGLKLVINPADFSHLKITDEFLFEKIYDLDKVPFKPDCIIDCGAHIGMFTLLSKSKFKTTPIYIFEPNPKNVAYIKTQINVNSLENVHLEEAAVSTYDGNACFENSEISFGGYISENPITNKSYQVKVLDLSRYIGNIGPKKLLIKIDIEGEEEVLIPELLKILPKQCVLFFEYHFGIEKFRALQAKLQNQDYHVSITRIIDDLYIDAMASRNAVT